MWLLELDLLKTDEHRVDTSVKNDVKRIDTSVKKDAKHGKHSCKT